MWPRALAGGPPGLSAHGLDERLAPRLRIEGRLGTVLAIGKGARFRWLCTRQLAQVPPIDQSLKMRRHAQPKRAITHKDAEFDVPFLRGLGQVR